jgi:hypothetical protein
MTHDEWRRLMLLRRELTGETFNDGTLDAWDKAHPTVGYVSARSAMTAAAKGHDRVTLHHFTDALPTSPRRPHTDPIGTTGCAECDGTGFSPRPDEAGVIRYGPCATCRPASP